MKTPPEILPESLTSSVVFSEEEKARVYEEIKAKHEREYAEHIERTWLDICPRIYNEALDYSKIKPEANHQKIRSLVSWETYPKGVFVMGPTGRAKTRACWAALKARFLEGKSIRHVSSFQFAQDALRSTQDVDAGAKIMGRYVNADILFLDDVGKRPTPSSFQFLFEILERRMSQDKAVVCTSNDTLATLSEAIGDMTIADPITRRIREFCDLIILP